MLRQEDRSSFRLSSVTGMSLLVLAGVLLDEMDALAVAHAFLLTPQTPLPLG